MALRWIFCGGMPRSGSTLQYNIAAELVERLGIGRRERWVDDHKDYFSKPDEDIVIVFKSHLMTPEIEECFKNGNAKGLVSYRDVRDSTASWQAKTRTPLSLDQAIQFSDDAIDMFRAWKSIEGQGVYFSKYEDFYKDIESEVIKIANFIGVITDDFILKSVINAVSVESIKEGLKKIPENQFTQSGPFTWNAKTLVHTDHLNGGYVGRYKSEMQSEIQHCLTERHRAWLEAYGYAPD